MEVDVANNLRAVQRQLPTGVQLVAVSKFHPDEYVQAAYDAGQRIFGESHEQELAGKVKRLPKDIEWHFIGHLQTNKVRRIVPYIHTIEAVDSLRLLEEIEKQAARVDRVVRVMLELHIAEEETKYGFTLDECRKMLAEGKWRTMTHVQIVGLMMMASQTDQQNKVREEMMQAAHFFDEVKRDYFANNPNFRERSWGMSHDFTIAVECQSTMVRVGTAIFGPRVY